MKNVRSYRAMSSICRQRAVFDPENSWKHLGDAERWDHLAHAEIEPTSENATPLAQVTRLCLAYLPTRVTRDGGQVPPRDTLERAACASPSGSTLTPTGPGSGMGG